MDTYLHICTYVCTYVHVQAELTRVLSCWCLATVVWLSPSPSPAPPTIPCIRPLKSLVLTVYQVAASTWRGEGRGEVVQVDEGFDAVQKVCTVERVQIVHMYNTIPYITIQYNTNTTQYKTIEPPHYVCDSTCTYTV